jgi:hypothetical protein
VGKTYLRSIAVVTGLRIEESRNSVYRSQPGCVETIATRIIFHLVMDSTTTGFPHLVVT